MVVITIRRNRYHLTHFEILKNHQTCVQPLGNISSCPTAIEIFGVYIIKCSFNHMYIRESNRILPQLLKSFESENVSGYINRFATASRQPCC